VPENLPILNSSRKEVTTMNPLYVGIDVSEDHNETFLMNSDGSKLSSFSVLNDRNGAKLLIERIISAMKSRSLSEVVIGLESTSVYGDTLVYALRESGGLGAFFRKIHVLNPKQVAKDLSRNNHIILNRSDDVIPLSKRF
jgi:hypothetical protein